MLFAGNKYLLLKRITVHWKEPMRPMPGLWLEHPQKRNKKTKHFTVKGGD
jgi:hypothetical protein